MEEQMSLINAAADGDVVNIRRLVAEGADVNVQDAEGEPCYTWRQIKGMWMRYECWRSSGLMWRHLTLMERERDHCTRRHITGRWQW
jgi:hypothetical protein